MSLARETVMEALLQRLAGAGDFRLVTRRLREPKKIPAAETPALMLAEHSDGYRVPTPSAPPVRRIMARALVYVDCAGDEDAVPSSQINAILDRLDALLAPDSATTGRCTLGGLVQSCVIDGTVVRSPGDLTGRSLAVVPLDILLP